jgi:hypothetical protein
MRSRIWIVSQPMEEPERPQPMLVDAASAEFDQSKRKAIFVQVAQTILHNDYLTFLFWNPTREVASDRAQAIRHDVTGIWRYEEMWLEAGHEFDRRA